MNIDESNIQYVYYQGTKEGSEFVIEFLIYSNNSFKISGALEYSIQLADYSAFSQNILDSRGIS